MIWLIQEIESFYQKLILSLMSISLFQNKSKIFDLTKE